MALKCKTCGGKVFYDIEKNKLKCEYCSMFFDVDSYNEDNDAVSGVDYTEGYRVDVFRCKNCGALLNAPKEQIVSYCNYCGSEAMELSKQAPGDEPVGIVPFKISAEEAKTKYREYLKKALFLPDELLTEDYSSEFRGIYIPYWETTVDVESRQFKLKGTKDYTQGRYDYHEEYDIEVAVNGNVDGGFYDASAAFDDTVAAEIAPFEEKTQPFKEGYLAGYYADTVTAEKEEYEELAKEQAVDNISNRISSRVNGAKINRRVLRKNLEIENKAESQITLFPIWFHTWRKGNRVAYSVINGQTGKLAVDLPIDYKKFFRCAGIQAIVYFLILCILPLFQLPLHVASSLSVLSYLTAAFYSAELRQIRQREQHVFDYGYQNRGIFKKRKLKYRYNEGPVILKILWYLIIIIVFFGSFETETPDDVKGFIALFVIIQLFPTIKSCINLLGISSKLGFIAVVISEGAQIAGVILAGKYHPEDVWYYIIGLLFFVGMLANILMSIYYTNYLTTRPVPNFFNREGGKHEFET